MSWRGEWRPYVPVAKRQANAKKYAESLAKKEKRSLEPIEIAGRGIARTFWGQAWCENLESYSDFENRLPRGRTYVRNGSVIDLRITDGAVRAIVSGSEIYQVRIDIEPLRKPHWKKIRQDCARSIGSLIDLLQGRFSQGVMERLTRQKEGLFPQPAEIEIRCSCPDWATLCKHAAAVLYGVGARLDSAPELLFLLRKVDHLELIDQAVDGANLDAALGSNGDGALAGENLSELFGIDLDAETGSRATGDPANDGARAGGAKASRTRSRNGRKSRQPQAEAAEPPTTKNQRGPAKTRTAKKPAATAKKKPAAAKKPVVATKRTARKKPAVAAGASRKKSAARPAVQSTKARKKTR